MKRVIAITLIVAALTVGGFAAWYYARAPHAHADTLMVGFVFESDESTQDTYSFTLARDALEKQFEGRVRVVTRSNVPEGDTAEPLRALCEDGCGLIFIDSYSPQVAQVAAEFPGVQFCQKSFEALNLEGPDNFHTFNARYDEGRYLCGIAAGLKLRALLDAGEIAPDEALVGFVGTTPGAEVLSNATAFLLGVRSVAPEATMRLSYTGKWSDYTREKTCAEALLAEGCVLIAQHAQTNGPAAACEAKGMSGRAFHVGFNRSMIDIAPTTSLISLHLNWKTYVLAAARAVLEGTDIESAVPGSVHGNDVCGGLRDGWIELGELNDLIAAEGTAQALADASEALQKGETTVFSGDYAGVAYDDAAQTLDLNGGFQEYALSSRPMFRYLLEDIVTVQ